MEYFYSIIVAFYIVKKYAALFLHVKVLIIPLQLFLDN